MADDEFVNKLTSFLKGEDEKAQIENKRRVYEAETIKSHAPKQWEELRQWIKALAEQVNRENGPQTMTVRASGNKELAVDIKVGAHSRLLQAIFDEPTNTINYDSGRRKFSPFIDSSGFGFTEGNRRVTTEEMGQILIRATTDMH